MVYLILRLRHIYDGRAAYTFLLALYFTPSLFGCDGADGPRRNDEGRLETGRALFAPYATHIDLPLENTSKNFDVLDGAPN